MNKILITGGAGFLGSHLSEKLLKEGNAGDSKIPKQEIFRGIKKLFSLAIERSSNLQDDVIRSVHAGICPKCSSEYLYEALPKVSHATASTPTPQNCSVKCLQRNYSFFS